MIQHHDKPRLAPQYSVVRRAGDDWGVFKVEVAQDQLTATMIDRTEGRRAAFRSARGTAAWAQVPLMGAHGLEYVPPTEVQF